MRETVKAAFKSNPLTSIVLVVLLVGVVLVGTQGYLSRHENWQRDYDNCIDTVANRWQSSIKERKNAEREVFLAGGSKGEEATLHIESADEATKTAEALEKTSAPTEERQVAYCKRTNPEPGIFG